MENIGKALTLVTNGLLMLPFVIFNADMTKDLFPGIKEEVCKTGAFGSKGPCSEALEFTVGKIYLQASLRHFMWEP